MSSSSDFTNGSTPWPGYDTDFPTNEDHDRVRIVLAVAAVTVAALLPSVWTKVSPWHASTERSAVPSRAPYAVPFLGHLLQIARSGADFVTSVRSASDPQEPVRMRVWKWDVYVLNGAKSIATLFQRSRGMQPASVMIPLMLRNGCGASEGTLGAYRIPGAAPAASRTPHYHVPRALSSTLAKALSGGHLKQLAHRFTGELSAYMGGLDIGHEWSARPDLYLFVRRSIFQCATNSLCGELLLKESPEFADDFWEFDKNVVHLMSGLPRFVFPSAWASRDRCLESVKRWLGATSDKGQSPDALAKVDEVDEVSELFTAHRGFFASSKDTKGDSHASVHLGLLWGINANSTPLTFWTVFEVLKIDGLVERVRREARSAILPESTGGHVRFDVEKLCRNPLLQSIYAEAARLHVNIMHMRGLREDLRLGPWTLGREKLVLFSTYATHRDASTWNTGTADRPRPLDTFWPERFLVDPNDPTSGPLKPGTYVPRTREGDQDGGPRFSLDGLTGMWIPYGGGDSICPGRFFAKQEILLGLAMIVTLFDIQLTPGGTLELDKSRIGIGASAPKGTAPFEIRRRDWESAEV